MFGISYWAVPIFSAVVWTAMLITMLVYWAASGRPIYETMDNTRKIPYISGKCNRLRHLYKAKLYTMFAC